MKNELDNRLKMLTEIMTKIGPNEPTSIGFTNVIRFNKNI